MGLDSIWLSETRYLRLTRLSWPGQRPCVIEDTHLAICVPTLMLLHNAERHGNSVPLFTVETTLVGKIT